MKKTKIICTVGPSTDNVELLRKMMLAGMDLHASTFRTVIMRTMAKGCSWCVRRQKRPVR